mmetsp:Transcript_142539/g.361917  ORF Transcript_142539/g.361917 Transcript_142539/m.361917 type:complete len:283 (+) Transcript_142539:2888-3736(+)
MGPNAHPVILAPRRSGSSSSSSTGGPAPARPPRHPLPEAAPQADPDLLIEQASTFGPTTTATTAADSAAAALTARGVLIQLASLEMSMIASPQLPGLRGRSPGMLRHRISSAVIHQSAGNLGGQDVAIGGGASTCIICLRVLVAELRLQLLPCCSGAAPVPFLSITVRTAVQPLNPGLPTLPAAPRYFAALLALLSGLQLFSILRCISKQKLIKAPIRSLTSLSIPTCEEIPTLSLRSAWSEEVRRCGNEVFLACCFPLQLLYPLGSVPAQFPTLWLYGCRI